MTLRAADDSDLINGSRTITHTSSGGGYTATADLVATEAENDKAISLTPSTLSVTEGGTESYTVKLTVVPTADVTVTIAAGTGDSDIAVKDTDDSTNGDQTGTITFTSQNWSTARTVVLTAAEDDTDLTNGSRAITHTAASTDTGYSGVTASLTATETDNDNATSDDILLRNDADDADITTLGVGEGATATYKVKLGKEPRANVTVTIAEATTGNAIDSDITVTNPSNKTLSFTPSNWNTAQTVTLRALQDSGMAFGKRTITHTASGADSGYAGATAVNLTAYEMDDDVMIELLDESNNDTDAMTIKEGSAGAYRVKLTAQPLGNVTVTLTATGDNDITFDTSDLPGVQTTLTFTTSTWNNTQNVTVNAAPDSDNSNGTKTITHRASGGGYDYAATATLTITEDDGPSLYVNPATITATTAVLRVYNHTGNWYYKGNVGPHTSCSAVQTSSTATVTGLTKSSSYTYGTFTDAGCTTANALTPEATFRTVTPSMTQSNVTGTTATLTLERWDLTKDGSWYYKANAAPHMTCSSAQTALTVDLTGLTKNASYLYTAYSDSGCTTEIAATNSFTTANPALAVSSIAQTTATLTLSGWSIADNGNWYYKSIGVSATPCSSAQSSLTADLTGLTANTSYVFVAYSDSGCTTQQAIAASFNTTTSGGNQIQQDPQGQQGQQESQPPASVGSVSASRSGGNIEASWGASARATGYHVVYSTDGGYGWTRAASNHSGTSYTITGADAGLSYVVGVQAVNSAGGSSWVNSNEVPKAASPPASVGSVNATRSHGSIDVTWDAPNGATKYHVTYTTDGGNSWMLLASEHSSTSISIVNAANDKAYMVGVRAGNDGGWSGWVNSNEVPKVTPPPGPVGSVSATHNGSSVSVTWDAADHATGYDVVYSTDGKASWTRAATNHGGTSYTLNGADSQLAYVFGVRAVNESGASGWTNSNSASASNPN